MSTLALITILLLSHGLVCAQDVRDEEVDDYFNKWLREDTVYIISPEERSVFEKLSSPEEKERFIEQFWFRRDPDPGNAFNEFKEEHYRRIAYANEHYKAGKAGWTTDRGRIYIIHGPPANIMMRPMGGLHKRTLQEGGGATTTFPHEVWSYRYIEGIGNDVEFEFVDSNLSGNYRLALTPDEKDALLHTGLGATLEESLGMKTRADRIREQTMLRPLEDRTLGAHKSPIERLQNYFQAFRNPEITYHDLQKIVETRVTYEELPLGTRADYFWVAGERFMATVTLQLANRELTYKQDGARNGARVDVYGAVQDLSGKTAYEFEQTLFVNTPSEIAIEKGHTLYQHAIPLEPGRYKLDWVVRDLHSGKLGTSAHALVLPRRGKDEFFTSSLILADRIRGGSGDPLEPFNTLSGLKVYPNVEEEHLRPRRKNRLLFRNLQRCPGLGFRQPGSAGRPAHPGARGSGRGRAAAGGVGSELRQRAGFWLDHTAPRFHGARTLPGRGFGSRFDFRKEQDTQLPLPTGFVESRRRMMVEEWPSLPPGARSLRPIETASTHQNTPVGKRCPSLSVRGESPASTETVPAPAGQGAIRVHRIPGVCARIATPSAGMQGRSNAVMTFATGCYGSCLRCSV